MSEFERGYDMGIEDGHRCERRHAQLDQLETDVQQLREQNRVLASLLAKAQPHVCSALCPSVKRDGDLWTHKDLCAHMESALTATSQFVGDIIEHDQQTRRAALLEAAQVIPRNWLDPLLKGVRTSSCPEIEQLLQSIKAEIDRLAQEG